MRLHYSSALTTGTTACARRGEGGRGGASGCPPLFYYFYYYYCCELHGHWMGDWLSGIRADASGCLCCGVSIRWWLLARSRFGAGIRALTRKGVCARVGTRVSTRVGRAGTSWLLKIYESMLR